MMRAPPPARAALACLVGVSLFAPAIASAENESAPAADPEPYVSAFSDEDEGVASEPRPVRPLPAPTAAEAPKASLVLEGIDFENREYFREETIRRFLTHPRPGPEVVPLDEALLESDARILEGKYQSRAYLKARVDVKLVPGVNPFGRRAVFVIQAGPRAPLKSVEVSGNHRVDDEALRAGFFSRPAEPLGAFTQAGTYHKPFADQDIQRLLNNYYARGHLEARVVGDRLHARSELDSVELVFDVEEGPVYELAALRVEGDRAAGETAESLRGRVSVKDGDVADLVAIQRDADALLDGLREEGHPFARVEQGVEVGPPPSGREGRKGVTITLTLVAGPAARVGEVRIVGNVGLLYGTMDHVIRRDVGLKPGARYRLSKVKKTERDLMRLGYFSAVEVRPVATAVEDVVDLEVKVTEQMTALFSIAPAYLVTEGPLLIGILGDRNLLGTGISATFIGTMSFQRQVFDVTVTEPRLLGTRIALTGEAHRREWNFPSFRLTSHFGGGARLSFPVGDVYFSAGAMSEYGGVTNLRDEERDFAAIPSSDLFPQDVFRNLLSFSVTYDRRDSVLAPRNGVYASMTSSYGGDYTLSGISVLKHEASLKLFWTPLWGITLKSNTRVGLASNPHGGEVSVTDRTYLGGLGSVRGYFPRSIAPYRSITLIDGSATKIQVGGTRSFIQGSEIEFPIWPGVDVLRAFVFVDAGNAYDDNEPMLTLMGEGLNRDIANLPLGLFWSAGGGILIPTPIAPLRFEWSIPLTRRARDRQLDFFTGVGSAF